MLNNFQFHNNISRSYHFRDILDFSSKRGHTVIAMVTYTAASESDLGVDVIHGPIYYILYRKKILAFCFLPR